MPASIADIDRWLAKGKKQGASHVVVLVDSYDHDNFPLYVMPGQDPRKEYENKKAEYARTAEGCFLGYDECYDLSLNTEEQKKERRSQHWEPWKVEVKQKAVEQKVTGVFDHPAVAALVKQIKGKPVQAVVDSTAQGGPDGYVIYHDRKNHLCGSMWFEEAQVVANAINWLLEKYEEQKNV